MRKSTDVKNVVKGIKELQLDILQAQTPETPDDSRAASPVKVTIPGQVDISKMSLPGLDISAPVETVVSPTVHELKEQTEWRFEVAFGSKVEVRVRKRALFPTVSVKY